MTRVNKEKKKTLVRALCLAIAIVMVGLIIFTAIMSGALASSYDSITHAIGTADDWKRIVTDSKFKLADILPETAIGYGTYPSLDGSTVSVPMAMEFARQHLLMSAPEDLTSFVFFTTTHNAYVNLIEKKPNPASKIYSAQSVMEDRPVDLFIGTEPSEDELALAKENGVELVKIPAALDAFVFIVNASNPVDSLTVEQIRSIYSGKIKNWKDVGGADKNIDAYQRPANSGSQTAMINLVMNGEELEGAKPNYISSGMESMVATIGDYDNGEFAIGYTYLYYLNELVDRENVKVLAIDGIAPTAKNIQASAYPFGATYWAVYRADDETNAGGEFARWIASDEGQQCVAQAGYIPVKAVE
ncbi:MAG: substrate-binding domain-containing protein [Oscillospiraceae bacterium]|jgi:phosphate transport system substrate-binding protein|nr:substrate-binding domain-containing protein [Oscillospiraceae bacterium]